MVVSLQQRRELQPTFPQPRLRVNTNVPTMTTTQLGTPIPVAPAPVLSPFPHPQNLFLTYLHCHLHTIPMFHPHSQTKTWSIYPPKTKVKSLPLVSHSHHLVHLDLIHLQPSLCHQLLPLLRHPVRHPIHQKKAEMRWKGETISRQVLLDLVIIQ
ncbi:uncharacterized protein EI90DRAFT_3039795 [Cantharellus anzutake]|uniref:uncharacterized protein n=1 Tax=Cantharellus anzutake TaxID=1750568 RepID=UPI00190860F5|nr:uncharacterized protein EI90DRAFT_3039795 [Cantharellus anzutake]KAF8338949.1 hypothetical protein EI90DRAFT_3039795 [Cantharellus anzutake]